MSSSITFPLAHRDKKKQTEFDEEFVTKEAKDQRKKMGVDL